MHIVAIHGWREVTPELVQALAAALGLTAFEARQRLIGGGPSVVAGFADPPQALELATKLNQQGIATLVVDATEVLGGAGRFIVRRFELGAQSLGIETDDGKLAEIPCGEIDLLLPGTSISDHTETRTVAERKFSLGKTLLAGGIPMTKKTVRREEVTTEARRKVLYLYAGSRPPAVFNQDDLAYDKLGAAMKLSRELNFAWLTSELRRLCPQAGYDDRLLNRVGQARLLGTVRIPGADLDLAAEILARSLRRGNQVDMPAVRIPVHGEGESPQTTMSST